MPALGLLALLLALLLAACGDSNAVQRWNGQTMGTYYRVTLTQLDAAQQQQLPELKQLVERELESVSAQMSTYLADSEVSLFNRIKAGQCMAVSDALLEVVRTGLQIGEASGGSFNVMLAPLIQRWGFGSSGQAETIPGREEVDKLLALGSADAISFIESPPKLCKHIDGAALELSALAKGHGVDRLAQLLELRGFRSYLVDIGGELRVAGLNPQLQLWQLAVENPLRDAVPGAAAAVARLALTNHGVATSGDYRNYFSSDGVIYSHTLNPRTGYPVQHDLASVTVIDNSTMTADAWATALLAAGPERAAALAEQRDLAVLLLRRKAAPGWLEQGNGLWR